MTTNRKKMFWLVWNPQGCAPQRRHDTEEDASHEAERLARLNRGARFIVLRPVREVVVDDVQRFEYEPAAEDEETPF